MPPKFTSCVSGGGRVRRIIPKSGVYLNVCYPKGGGSPVRGEVHHYKKNPGAIPIIDDELAGAGYRGGISHIGQRRFGHPRTNAERAVRHKAKYGGGKLPARGTGLLAEASKLIR